MVFAPVELLSLDGFGPGFVSSWCLVLPIRVLAILGRFVVLTLGEGFGLGIFVVGNRFLVLFPNQLLQLSVECNDLLLL